MSCMTRMIMAATIAAAATNTTASDLTAALSVNTVSSLGIDCGDPIVIFPLSGYCRCENTGAKRKDTLSAMFVNPVPNAEDLTILKATFPSQSLIGKAPNVQYAEFIESRDGIVASPNAILSKNDAAQGAKALPIHASDGRSFQQTALFPETGEMSEGNETFYVVSRINVWARGRYFQLDVSVTENASTVSNAVGRTRKLVNDWYEAVVATNGLPDPNSPAFLQEKENAEFAIKTQNDVQKQAIESFEDYRRQNQAREFRKMTNRAQLKGGLIALGVFAVIAMIVWAVRSSGTDDPSGIGAAPKSSSRQEGANAQTAGASHSPTYGIQTEAGGTPVPTPSDDGGEMQKTQMAEVETQTTIKAQEGSNSGMPRVFTTIIAVAVAVVVRYLIRTLIDSLS